MVTHCNHGNFQLGKTGGRNPGVMASGSLQEMSVGGKKTGIPKGAGAGRNRKQNLQHGAVFHNRESTQRQEALWKGMNRYMYKVWEVGNSEPLPPHPHPPYLQYRGIKCPD